MSVQNNGVTGVVSASLPILMTMVAFLTISLYNVLELNVIIFSTFKRRKGLYFWSFVVATWGIAPHAVGFTLKFFGVTSVWWFPLVLISIGWWAMVTGQSFVLYSRLHLIVQNKQKLRWVLCMIIFNAIIFGIPDTVLAWLASIPNPHSALVHAFTIVDKIQVGVFCVQESIISGIYIYETVQLLGPASQIDGLRKLYSHLILVNVVVLIFEITLLATEYSGNYEIQTPYKAAIYSVKLKIEFSVLNRLLEVVNKRGFSLEHLNSHQSNSQPLDALTNSAKSHFTTMTSATHAGSIETDNPPSHMKGGGQQKGVKTTELYLERDNTADSSDSTLRERQNVKGGALDTSNSVHIERSLSASESHVQLADEYKRG